MDDLTAVILRGLLVAVFLFSIDLDIRNWRWWFAMLSLHGMIVL